MLRIIQSKNSVAAQKYYEDGLSQSDYYSEGQKVIGTWHGKGRELLGLPEEVVREDFQKVVSNTHPTQKTKISVRLRDDRSPGYDFNFHVPKSISIVHALNKDERIVAALKSATNATMKLIEEDVEVRDQRDYTLVKRKSGTLLWANFIHGHSRPVDGVPDPHLHVHAYVPNLTFDPVTKEWKAAYFRNVKANGDYYQAIFHKELSLELQKIGYSLAPQKRHFEIEGIEQELLTKFSRRHTQITTERVRRGITSDKIADSLASKTRVSKKTSLTDSELDSLYRERLSPSESRILRDINLSLKNPNPPTLANSEQVIDSVAFGINHTLERSSTVKQTRVLTEALHHSLTSNVTLRDLKKELNKGIRSGDILSKNLANGYYLTTPQATKEETQLIEIVQNQNTSLPSLHETYQPKFDKLNENQLMALYGVLTSTQEIMYIQGKAGSGKTTVLKEIKEAARERGVNLNAFAPTTNASRTVLRSEGFTQADTVSTLLTKPEIRKTFRSGFLIIDEAGLLGAKTTNEILQVAKEEKARVILVGDTRQHSAITRGDTLRIIEQKTQTAPYSIDKNMRQEVQTYREAVDHFSEGEVEVGFEKLNELKAIKEIPDSQERYTQLANEYTKDVQNKGLNSVLIVAPTHQEIAEINQAVRQSLKENQVLTGREEQVTFLKKLSLTEAQKREVSTYTDGQIIRFNRRYSKINVGGRAVVGVENQEVYLTTTNNEKIKLDLTQSNRFDLYIKTTQPVASGELLRMTCNSLSANNKQLRNNTVYRVKGFEKNRNIRLTNGTVLDKNFGYLDYGYARTSHASQGLTVDKVIVAQSKSSLPATSKEQAYVSYSRARKAISIYTDDQKQLVEAVQKNRVNLFASDIAPAKSRRSPTRTKKKSPTPKI